MALSEQEIDLVSKSQHEDEDEDGEEARYWKNAKLIRPRIFIGLRGGMYHLSGNSKRYI